MVTNIVNGDRYVGMTTKDLDGRKYEHLWHASKGKSDCPYFYSALRKYGFEKFLWQVIYVTTTFQDLQNAEVRLISEIKPEYNISKGGRGRLGVAAGGMLGKKHSAVTKQRLRELGLKNKDKWEHYSSMGPASQRRKVVCLDTGIVYNSIREASENTGADRATISEVCLKYKHRNTANGLVFRFFGEHLGGLSEVENIKRERSISRHNAAKIANAARIAKRNQQAAQ